MKFYLTLTSVYSLLATVLITVLAFQNFNLKQPKPSETINWERIHPISTQQDPSLGSDQAPVTVTVFLSFDCLYCDQTTAKLRDLVEQYAGEVRVTVKHLATDPQSPLGETVKAALAAHVQGRFWDMQDLLYANRDRWGEQLFSEAAETLELDLESFQRDRRLPLWHNRLLENLTMARRLEVRGTPTFFVNGIKVPGADFSNLEKVIAYWLKRPSAA